MITVDFDKLSLGPGQKVLDLGCGEGRHATNIFLHADVISVGIDMSQRDVTSARDKAQPFVDVADQQRGGEGVLAFGVGDALCLPFAADTFDVVVCSEVLEHITDYESALREIDRVLKPGGVFVASVPTFFPEWVCWKLSSAYHQVEGGHVRIFRERGLRGDIEALGHRYFARHKAHALHSPYWWLRCLFWDSQDSSRLVRWYHKLLVWDLMQKPALTRWLEKLLNPILGKSIVLYFVKPESPEASTAAPADNPVGLPA